MRITNLGVGNTSLLSKLQSDETTTAGDSATLGIGAEAQGYSPSTVLQHLIHLVRQEPDVRADHVQAAQQRLGQGHYHTQASAASTAAGMLSTLD
jgi:hypothetical protein